MNALVSFSTACKLKNKIYDSNLYHDTTSGQYILQITSIIGQLRHFSPHLRNKRSQDNEESFNKVRLTHFVQGRSPLNPFLEGPPQRKVPENLHSETATQAIYQATL